MCDEHDKILAALAVGYQKISDRQETVEDVFGQSLIIPGNKINSILLVFAFIFVIVCVTFMYTWYVVRPI